MKIIMWQGRGGGGGGGGGLIPRYIFQTIPAYATARIDVWHQNACDDNT